MQDIDFQHFRLDLSGCTFADLAASVEFENIGKGRRATNILLPKKEAYPIVRTTTLYEKAAFVFADIHKNIAEMAQKEVARRLGSTNIGEFNNGLIEIYEPTYSKMGYHSDQALDLAEGSYIALFSCYEQGQNTPKNALRKLKIQDKRAEREREYALEHNSFLFFSLKTNANFLHKIILENSPKEASRWLGITFRQSKTWLTFQGANCFFQSGMPLLLADAEQRKTFFALRAEENRSLDFEYPELAYTLSASDLLLPKNTL